MLDKPGKVIDRMQDELHNDSADPDMLWYVNKIDVQGVRDMLGQITGGKPSDRLLGKAVSYIRDLMDDAGNIDNLRQFIDDYQEDGQ